MFKKLSVFLLCGLLCFGSCCAMERGVITWREFVAHKDDMAKTLEIVEHLYSELEIVLSGYRGKVSEEKLPVAAMRHDLIAQFVDAQSVITGQTFESLPIACEALQRIWCDAQTAVGIAPDEQKPLLIGDDFTMAPEVEAMAVGGRVLMRRKFEFKINSLLHVYEEAVVRVLLMHEASHIKLKNVEKLQRTLLENLYPKLTDGDVVFANFLKTLDGGSLTCLRVDSTLVDRVVNMLQAIDVNGRIQMAYVLLVAHHPDLNSSNERLMRDMEYETDRLMLEKIDCAYCLHCFEFWISDDKLDSARIFRGYASLRTIREREDELEAEGKCETCAIHVAASMARKQAKLACKLINCSMVLSSPCALHY